MGSDRDRKAEHAKTLCRSSVAPSLMRIATGSSSAISICQEGYLQNTISVLWEQALLSGNN